MRSNAYIVHTDRQHTIQVRSHTERSSLCMYEFYLSPAFPNRLLSCSQDLVRLELGTGLRAKCELG